MEKATLMSEEEISPELYRELLREVAQEAKKRADEGDKLIKQQVQNEIAALIKKGYGK